MQGGFALPNIVTYQQTALTESLLQWWNKANRSCWEFEQLIVKVPLSEWALMVKNQPKIYKNITLHRFSPKLSPT